MKSETIKIHEKQENPLDTEGLCLLSLDGGGVRGLSTLYILKGLMDNLNYGRPKENRLKPCDVFDLIGGTSTGGLIAIMLGRLEMDVDECIEAYIKLMTRVFEKESKFKFFSSLVGGIEGRFDAKRLETAISDVISSHGANPTDPFNDGVERRCKVISVETKSIVRIQSYYKPYELNVEASILEAARATSAATTFFDPVQVGGCKYADGALGANNPVEEVEGEASDIWCNDTGDLKPLVKCFISIGTGNPGMRPMERNAIKFLSRSLVRIVTETEATEKRFMASWRQHFDEKRYFRFNVDQGLQDVRLEEYKQKSLIQKDTEAYFNHQAVKIQTRDCVENLRLKQGATGPHFSEIMNKVRIQEANAHYYCSYIRWHVPFDRNTKFIGRESLLDDLEQRLQQQTMEKKTAVIGLGGVGKTHLVLEFAYRVREYCAVYWIPVNSLPNIQTAYKELAVKLQLPGSEKTGANAPELVQKHLSHEPTGPWLLVLDNADDIDLLTSPLLPESSPKSLVEYLPQGSHGSVIFTTRNRKAAVDLAGQHVVDVPELSEPEAITFLHSYITNKELVETEAEARQSILKELTYLPLAIVQAASYINKNAISLSHYRDILLDHEQNATELLHKDFHDSGRIPHTENAVAKSWIISFQQICYDDPLAAKYLSFMACISPNNIPVSVLAEGPSEVEKTDAIGTLDAYSFVKKHTDGGFLDMHRLVHLCTRGWLRKKQELPDWDKTVTRKLGNLLGQPLGGLLENSSKAYPTQWSVYIPHAEFAIANVDEDDNSDELIDLTLKCGDCLYHDGIYNRAEKMYWKVVEHQNKRHSPDYHVTFSCLNNLGLVFFEQGKLQEAEAMHKQALTCRAMVLGLENPHTVTSMDILGLTFSKQGKLQAAETMHRQALKSRTEILGPEDPYTLMSLDNLGLALCEQCRCQEAEPMLQQASEISERVLGPDHPHTLSSMHNLGLSLLRQSKIYEAETAFQKALDGRERVLGPEHPHTLISKDNLGLVMCQQGKLQEAETLFQQALSIREKVLEPGHPQILNNMHNLGIVLFYEGRYEESRSFYQHALQGRVNVLGPEHPDTLTTMQNLAAVLYKQDKLQEAEFIYQYGLESNIKVFGLEHQNTISSMHNLALIRATTGSKDNVLRLEWKENQSEKV